MAEALRPTSSPACDLHHPLPGHQGKDIGGALIQVLLMLASAASPSLKLISTQEKQKYHKRMVGHFTTTTTTCTLHSCFQFIMKRDIKFRVTS